jgi:hypothetical protein
MQSITKKKSRRGGARPGAGRKRKDHRSPTALTELDVKAAQMAPVPVDIESVAQQHAKNALAALMKQVISGAGDQARVNAANAILDRGYGRPAVDTGGDAMMLPLPGLARVTTDIAEEIRAEARRNAILCIEVLLRITIGSEAEGARVSAARSLLDRGLGTVAIAKVPEDVARAALGKREQAVEDARAAATGVFATPKPPGEGTKH